jgi:hypothetical protein
MRTLLFVVAPVFLLAAARVAPQSETAKGVLGRVDHIVYAAPDLKAAVESFEQRTGVRATPGGQHPGRGTRNALVALGGARYLEIIGPDPEQPKPEKPRPFGIDRLASPRIVTWAAKSAELETLFANAANKGIRLGEVGNGSRKRPDGVLLTWRYTNPGTVVADGVVPFFIDWGQTPHPSAGAAGGVTLVRLAAEHPDADRVQKTLRDLGLDLTVKSGAHPALIATLDTPRGRIELR